MPIKQMDGHVSKRTYLKCPHIPFCGKTLPLCMCSFDFLDGGQLFYKVAVAI